MIICLQSYRDGTLKYLDEPTEFKPHRRTAPKLDILSHYEARGYELTWYKKIVARGSNEPYVGGCTNNLVWRSKRPKIWNRPVPYAIEVKPDSAIIGKGVPQGGTDPLMWMDRKYGVTLAHINARRGKALVIKTRSDLIANDEYMGALDRQHHSIFIHVFSEDDQITQLLEPGAPSVKRRMLAYQKLKAAGFKVYLVHDKVRTSSNLSHERLRKINSFTYATDRFNFINLTPRALFEIDSATGIRLRVSDVELAGKVSQ